MRTFVIAAGCAVGITVAVAITLAPAAFVAVTDAVYVVPASKPVKIHDNSSVEHVAPPGVSVTVYALIGEPLILSGAVHETVADFSAATAATVCGTVGAEIPGGVNFNVTFLLSPIEFFETRTALYSNPFTSPEKVHVVKVVTHLGISADNVTELSISGDPLDPGGWVQLNVASTPSTLRVTFCGSHGSPGAASICIKRLKLLFKRVCE